MDAFYASVEQRDNPNYKGKPLAVGGSRERGVVAAASYEARKFGVYSAMPSVTAYRKCPHIIFVPPRFEVYKEVSNQIREIFKRYTDAIEPLSLDEAYLDVTKNKIGLPSATLIAKEIKNAIKTELNLTASAGISVNKFLAKVASDEDKPDGLFVITPDKVIPFIDQLSIDRFFGVGKVTSAKMKELGIQNGADLRKWELDKLIQRFGKVGKFFYGISRGVDHRPVNPNRIRKSIGVERTFDKDVSDLDEVREIIIELSDMAWKRCQVSGKKGRTVTLKIKYNDFTQITRSKTQISYFSHPSDLESTAWDLIKNQQLEKPIRLLGITLSHFKETEMSNQQLTLDF